MVFLKQMQLRRYMGYRKIELGIIGGTGDFLTKFSHFKGTVVQIEKAPIIDWFKSILKILHF